MKKRNFKNFIIELIIILILCYTLYYLYEILFGDWIKILLELDKY